MTREDLMDDYDDREYFARMQKEVAEWKERWPKHCTTCLGAGGFTIRNYPHAPDDFEVCSALPANQCHRCGYVDPSKNTDDDIFDCKECDDDSFVCKMCGWTGTHADDCAPRV